MGRFEKLFHGAEGAGRHARREWTHGCGDTFTASKSPRRIHAPVAVGRRDAAQSQKARGISIPLPLAGRSQGWGCCERGIDGAHDTFDVLQNVVVPEAENLKPIAGQTQITLTVGGCIRLFIVLAAVDFDHKTSRVAGKINDHPVDRNLTTKMHRASYSGAAKARAFSPPQSRWIGGGAHADLPSHHPTPPAIGGRPSPSRGG